MRRPKHRATPAVRYGETVVITALSGMVAWYISPQDPLLLHSEFPWLALAPMLAGLQHGFMPALVSCALLGAGAELGLAANHSYLSWLCGCALFSLLAGQFRDRSIESLERLDASAASHRSALSTMQHRFQLLQHAHAELQAAQTTTQLSLQDAAETAMGAMAGATSLHSLISELLKPFQNPGQVHSASLYLIERGCLLPTPVGTMGTPGSITVDHSLVQRALLEHRLVSISPGLQALQSQHDVLAAVPLLTSAGELRGVLAVHEMSFVAFQGAHLRRLLTLAGQLTDTFADRLASLQASSHERSEKTSLKFLAQGKVTGQTYPHRPARSGSGAARKRAQGRAAQPQA